MDATTACSCLALCVLLAGILDAPGFSWHLVSLPETPAHVPTLVQPKAGFGAHPHRDAEIFSYIVQASGKAILDVNHMCHPG